MFSIKRFENILSQTFFIPILSECLLIFGSASTPMQVCLDLEADLPWGGMFRTDWSGNYQNKP